MVVSHSFCNGVFVTLGVVVAMLMSPVSILEWATARSFLSYSVKHYEVAIMITGCASGIGRRTAMHMAQQEGYHVFCAVQKQEDALSIQQEASTVTEQAGRIQALLCDVTNIDQVMAVKDTVQQWLSEKPSQQEKGGSSRAKSRKLAGVINCAEWSKKSHMSSVDTLSLEDLDDDLDVHLKGPIRFYQAFLPVFRKQGTGRFIHLDLISGQVARLLTTTDTLSHFALEGLADAQRLETFSERIISISIIQSECDYVTDNPNLITVPTHLPEAAQQLMQDWLWQQGDGPDVKETDLPSRDAIVQDIIHALTSRKPKTRYFPGRTAMLFGLPTHFLHKLKMLLPDRAWDALPSLLLRFGM